MNREINFRGLRTDGKGWVIGLVIKRISKYYIETEFTNSDGEINYRAYQVIPKSIGQYIGKKDINGVEIYEWDICSGDSDGNGVITWAEFDGGYEYVYSDGGKVGLWEVQDYIEVIGNIHEKTK